MRIQGRNSFGRRELNPAWASWGGTWQAQGGSSPRAAHWPPPPFPLVRRRESPASQPVPTGQLEHQTRELGMRWVPHDVGTAGANAPPKSDPLTYPCRGQEAEGGEDPAQRTWGENEEAPPGRPGTSSLRARRGKQRQAAGRGRLRKEKVVRGSGAATQRSSAGEGETGQPETHWHGRLGSGIPGVARGVAGGSQRENRRRENRSGPRELLFWNIHGVLPGRTPEGRGSCLGRRKECGEFA